VHSPVFFLFLLFFFFFFFLLLLLIIMSDDETDEPPVTQGGRMLLKFVKGPPPPRVFVQQIGVCNRREGEGSAAMAALTVIAAKHGASVVLQCAHTEDSQGLGKYLVRRHGYTENAALKNFDGPALTTAARVAAEVAKSAPGSSVLADGISEDVDAWVGRCIRGNVHHQHMEFSAVK
jgi:hypothetical protein